MRNDNFGERVSTDESMADEGLRSLCLPVGAVPRRRTSRPETFFSADIIDGVHPGEAVGRVLLRMKVEGRPRLPLVGRDGRLLGVVGLDDIHAWLEDLLLRGRRGPVRSVRPQSTSRAA